jgi:Tannase and feruloyl esterase
MSPVMRRSSILVVVAAASAALAIPCAGGAQTPPAASPRPLYSDAAPARDCASLASVSLPDTTVESAVDDQGVCRVTAVVTHPPADDKVKIWVALPIRNWNGRFQGVGGGGFSGGNENAVRAPAGAGYVAASTDTGHPGGSGSFALDANGRLNWMLIRDNAYLGIHDMTVTAKALTAAFYGKPPRYSYFNGCSTGGRQGLSEAQRYPADYDGILSAAPAINWPKLHVEQLWGALVMLEAKNFVPMCKLNAVTTAAVEACDGLDGVKDGVIDDPMRCTFDPKVLVGTTAAGCSEFTDADATVVRKILDGPKRRDGSFLWYGTPRGALFLLSATGGTPLTAQPFAITLEWFRYFLTQNPKWEWASLTYATYEQLWDQSIEQFGPVLGTDNPDLSAYRDRGGKLVLWHGWADPLIYANGTIDYFTRVQRQMGGPEKTAAFARLFMAPGVGHCDGGPGPAPSGQFDAVVKWVEDGQAPETLKAVRRDRSGAVIRSRPLCQYPLVATYNGQGSTDDAGSFTCRSGAGR